MRDPDWDERPVPLKKKTKKQKQKQSVLKRGSMALFQLSTVLTHKRGCRAILHCIDLVALSPCS